MESGDGLAFQKKQIDLRCPITASQVAAALAGLCLASQMVRMPKKTDYTIHLQSSQAMVDKEEQL